MEVGLLEKFSHSGLGKKLLSLVAWIIVSLVVSVLLNAVAPNVDSILNVHESSVATSVVRPESIDVSLKDVGGLQKVKDELYLSLLLPLRYPEVFFRQRGPLSSTKGILLTGPPGCGKTMIAKAVAKTCGCTFVCPSLATLQSKYFGESPKLLTAMFAVARKSAPCILFFDEIDSAFRTRSEDDAGCEYTLKTEFLTLLDGLKTDASDAVVVVGATNNPSALDPALLRRMPNVIEIGLPTKDERTQIVKLLCQSEPNAARCVQAYDALEKQGTHDTEGMSGSDLAELYKSASRLRLREVFVDADASSAAITRLAERLPPLLLRHWQGAHEKLRGCKKATQKTHLGRSGRLERLLESFSAKPSKSNQKIENEV